MLEDPANYEAIGGDRYLSGYIKGFEIVSLPYIIPVDGLPSEVGETYTGDTLFNYTNGVYIANYEESMSIMEKIFPKDKVIFLMCGGGGYAGMTRNLLISLGWDENKIYNIGGHWYYDGKNNIEVKKDELGKYDFSSVPYHNIEFEKLTKSSEYVSPFVEVNEIKISKSNLELEEGISYKLNVIVLPNEATNKDVQWASSDENIATVTNDGIVKANNIGNAIITATSHDGNKKVTCDVIVKKAKVSEKITLDDISNEKQEMDSYSYTKLFENHQTILYDIDNVPRPEYFVRTNDEYGYYIYEPNEKFFEEEERYEKERNHYVEKRLEILNTLIDNKKTFIIIFEGGSCEQQDYSTSYNGKKILDENDYDYIYIYGGTESILQDSKLNYDNYISGSIIFVKEGKLYEYIDPEKHSFKNDQELKNWLNRFIDIK